MCFIIQHTRPVARQVANGNLWLSTKSHKHTHYNTNTNTKKHKHIFVRTSVTNQPRYPLPPQPHSQTRLSSGRYSGHKHFTDGEKVTALPIRQFPLFIGNDQRLFLPARPCYPGQGDKEISYRFLPPLSRMISPQYKSA